jgi:hypothetical protein
MEPRIRFQGMNSASLCSLAGRYDNPIPTRLLAPKDCLKIPAQNTRPPPLPPGVKVSSGKALLTKVVFLLPDSADAPSFRQLPSGVGDTPRGALSPPPPPPPPFTFSSLAPALALLRGGESDGVRRRVVRGSEPPRSPPPLPDRRTLVKGPAPPDTVYKS